MKMTRYFAEQVRRRRPYLQDQWFDNIASRALRTERQDDGRLRMWVAVVLPGEERSRALRVVLLDDGETIHNAFLDQNFAGDLP